MRQTRISKESLPEGFIGKRFNEKFLRGNIRPCAWTQMYHEPYKCDIPKARRLAIERSIWNEES